MCKLTLFIVLNIIFITTVALPKHEYNGKYEGNLLTFGNHNKRNNRVNKIAKLYYIADSRDSVISNAEKNNSVKEMMSDKMDNENRFGEEKQKLELQNIHNNTIYNLHKARNRLPPKFGVLENNNRFAKKYEKLENKTNGNVTRKGCSATTDQVNCADDAIKKYELYMNNDSSNVFYNISPSVQHVHPKKPKYIPPSIKNITNASKDVSQSILTPVSAKQENTIPLSVHKRSPRASEYEKSPNHIPPNNNVPPPTKSLLPSDYDGYNYISYDSDDIPTQQLDHKNHQTAYDPNNIPPNKQNQCPNIPRRVPPKIPIPVTEKLNDVPSIRDNVPRTIEPKSIPRNYPTPTMTNGPKHPNNYGEPNVSNNLSQPAPNNNVPSDYDGYYYISYDTDDIPSQQLDHKNHQTAYDPNNIPPNKLNQGLNIPRRASPNIPIPVAEKLNDVPSIRDNIPPSMEPKNIPPNYPTPTMTNGPKHPNNYGEPNVSNNLSEPAPNNEVPSDYDGNNYISYDTDDIPTQQLDHKNHQNAYDINNIPPNKQNQGPNIPRRAPPNIPIPVAEELNDVPSIRDNIPPMEPKNIPPNYPTPTMTNGSKHPNNYGEPNVSNNLSQPAPNNNVPSDYDGYYYIAYDTDDIPTQQLDHKNHQSAYDTNNIPPNKQNQCPNKPRRVPPNIPSPVTEELDNALLSSNKVPPPRQPNFIRANYPPPSMNNHPRPAPYNKVSSDKGDRYYISYDSADIPTQQLHHKNHQTAYDPNNIPPSRQNHDPATYGVVPLTIQIPVTGRPNYVPVSLVKVPPPSQPNLIRPNYPPPSMNNHPQLAPNYKVPSDNDDYFYKAYGSDDFPTQQFDYQDDQTANYPNNNPPNGQNQGPNMYIQIPFTGKPNNVALSLVNVDPYNHVYTIYVPDYLAPYVPIVVPVPAHILMPKLENNVRPNVQNVPQKADHTPYTLQPVGYDELPPIEEPPPKDNGANRRPQWIHHSGVSFKKTSPNVQYTYTNPEE